MYFLSNHNEIIIQKRHKHDYKGLPGVGQNYSYTINNQIWLLKNHFWNKLGHEIYLNQIFGSDFSINHLIFEVSLTSCIIKVSYLNQIQLFFSTKTINKLNKVLLTILHLWITSEMFLKALTPYPCPPLQLKILSCYHYFCMLTILYLVWLTQFSDCWPFAADLWPWGHPSDPVDLLALRAAHLSLLESHSWLP